MPSCRKNAHRRAFVVGHAATEQPSVATLDPEGIRRPTGTRRHDVDVCDGRDLRRTLAGDVAPTKVAVILARRIAQALRDTQSAIERSAHVRTEGGARSGIFGIHHRRMAHNLGDISNDILPYLVDIRVHARLELLIHPHRSPSIPGKATPRRPCPAGGAAFQAIVPTNGRRAGSQAPRQSCRAHPPRPRRVPGAPPHRGIRRCTAGRRRARPQHRSGDRL